MERICGRGEAAFGLRLDLGARRHGTQKSRERSDCRRRWTRSRLRSDSWWPDQPDDADRSLGSLPIDQVNASVLRRNPTMVTPLCQRRPKGGPRSNAQPPNRRFAPPVQGPRRSGCGTQLCQPPRDRVHDALSRPRAVRPSWRRSVSWYAVAPGFSGGPSRFEIASLASPVSPIRNHITCAGAPAGAEKHIPLSALVPRIQGHQGSTRPRRCAQWPWRKGPTPLPPANLAALPSSHVHSDPASRHRRRRRRITRLDSRS